MPSFSLNGKRRTPPIFFTYVRFTYREHSRQTTASRRNAVPKCSRAGSGLPPTTSVAVEITIAAFPPFSSLMQTAHSAAFVSTYPTVTLPTCVSGVCRGWWFAPHGRLPGSRHAPHPRLQGWLGPGKDSGVARTASVAYVATPLLAVAFIAGMQTAKQTRRHSVGAQQHLRGPG